MAASVDTLTLYERILSLVAPQELHHSCNDVLAEEISGLRKSVNDVLGIFSKVEEVREAVKQLEQAKGSTGRSASLMEVMDNTMALQAELGDKLGQVGTKMKKSEEVVEKKQVKEKKKREMGQESEEERKVQVKKKHKKEKNEEVVEKEKSPDLQVAHGCLKAIKEVKTINKRIQFDMQEQWQRAVFDVKRIIKRQSECDVQSTDKAAAEVTARALEASAEVFKKVEWTLEHVKEVQSLVAVLAYACSKNEVLRTYFHRVRAQLESLEMNIPTSQLKNVKDSKKPASAESEVDSTKQLTDTYLEMARSIPTLPENEKPKRVLEALGVIQQVLAKDETCRQQGEIRRAFEHVRVWIDTVPFQNNLADEYLRFANKVTDYSKRLTGTNNQRGWQRLATGLVTILEEKRKSLGEKPSHSSAKPSKKTIEVKHRLTSIQTQVEEWQDGIFSLDQVDKVMKAFNEVVSYNSMDWNPLTDPTVCTCVEKLKTAIQMIKKQAHRDKRLKTVNKWKTRIEKYR